MSPAHDARPALWLRVLQFPLVRLILLGGTLFLMMGVSNGFRLNLSAEPLLALAAAAGMATLGLAVYFGLVRLIERRPVSELALPGMGREFGTGLLIGAGLYTLCVLILMMLGVYRVDGINPWAFVLPAIAMALSSGVLEELIYRGVLFRVLEESFGSWISLAVSSLIFGLRHWLAPSGTLLGALCISIEAGLLLAAAYMLTRRLWMSIGFHMAWNYTQSGIFSGIVSGAYAKPGLIKATIEGPLVLTGGEFGLESSLMALLLCTSAGVMLLIKAIRRGNIVPPFWSRARAK